MSDIKSMAERVRLITDPAYTPPDPSTLVFGQCGYCFKINGHEEVCPRRNKPAFTLLPDEPARSGDYTAVIIRTDTLQWMKRSLAKEKAELIAEKRHYLRTRGKDCTLFVDLLAGIESDLQHINSLTDALP